METIVKNKHAEAHALIDGFLQRHKDRHGIYLNDLYKYLGADFVYGQTKTRKALVGILLEEQHGRCCYCMRRIEGLPSEEMSIEHVIVNHPIDANDYNQYLGRNSQLDSSDIISSSDFIARQVPPPPYPHAVAYENMLMSCAGHCHIGLKTSFTCNNHRGHRFGRCRRGTGVPQLLQPGLGLPARGPVRVQEHLRRRRDLLPELEDAHEELRQGHRHHHSGGNGSGHTGGCLHVFSV